MRLKCFFKIYKEKLLGLLLIDFCFTFSTIQFLFFLEI